MPNPRKLAFVAAMKDFFELKPGQTLSDFAAEVRALSDEERDEFKALLASLGYTFV